MREKLGDDSARDIMSAAQMSDPWEPPGRPDVHGPALTPGIDSLAHRVYLQGMTSGQTLVAAVIIEVIAWAAGHLVGVVLATLGIIIISLVTVRIHPRVRHVGWGTCNGTGEHRGAIFGWRHRRCARCNGGRLIGWGAGNFGSEHIQSEYVRSRQARAAAREGHSWR